MTADELQFFDGRPGALGLYEGLRGMLLDIAPEAAIRVQKTQITYKLRYGFAFVSFTPVRRRAERGPAWLTLSFGLPFRLDDPRVDAAAEARPNRWTHHILIDDPGQLDDGLRAILAQSAAFGSRR